MSGQASYTGKLVYDTVADFASGTFNNGMTNNSYIGQTRPIETGGVTLPTFPNDNTNPFHGAYVSPPLDLGLVEVSSVGTVSLQRLFYAPEAGKTTALYVYSAGSGAAIGDTSGNGLNMGLQASDCWLPFYYTEGLTSTPKFQFSKARLNGMKAQGSFSVTNYVAPFSMEIAGAAWGGGSLPTGVISYNPTCSAGNYQGAGQGFKLALETYVYTENWISSYIRGYRAVATMGKADGTDAVATAYIDWMAGPFTMSATYDGAALNVYLCTSSQTASGSVSVSNPAPSYGSSKIWGRALNIPNQEISFYAMRISNYALSLSQVQVNTKLNSSLNVGAYLQTRSAPTSGGLMSAEWFGSSADIYAPFVSHFEDLSASSSIGIGFNWGTLTSGASAISSSGSAASAFCDGNSSTSWTSSRSSSDMGSPPWAGYWLPAPDSIRYISFTNPVNTMANCLAIEVSSDLDNWKPVQYFRPNSTSTSAAIPLDYYGEWRGWRVRAVPELPASSPSVLSFTQLDMCQASFSKYSVPTIYSVADPNSPFKGNYSLDIQGDATSIGQIIPLRVMAQQLDPYDYLTAAFRCSNPNTVFRIKLFQGTSVAPPSSASAVHWEYRFNVDSILNWQELHFPDFTRASTVYAASGAYPWLGLEVYQTDGSFILWVDQMRFGKGAAGNKKIYNTFDNWLQYRLILNATN